MAIPSALHAKSLPPVDALDSAVERARKGRQHCTSLPAHQRRTSRALRFSRTVTLRAHQPMAMRPGRMLPTVGVCRRRLPLTLRWDAFGLANQLARLWSSPSPKLETKVERETGSYAPSTKPSVQFTYRLG